jgi:hypothetical protein
MELLYLYFFTLGAVIVLKTIHDGIGTLAMILWLGLCFWIENYLQPHYGKIIYYFIVVVYWLLIIYLVLNKLSKSQKK